MTPEGMPHRLRLRWPDGAELEAEGSAEFLRAERQEFITRLSDHRAATQGGPPSDLPDGGQPSIAWETITERRGRHIQLRAKLQGRSEKDACLVLLAASHKLLNDPKPTAGQLAKWLRGSGYPVPRMDRALQDAVTSGEILSSGSRRARRYELTAHGRLKAYILAEQLTKTIVG